MSSHNYVGYAQFGSSPVRMHQPKRQIPIIVVPGIMGSRLTDPRTDKLAWNPLGAPMGNCGGNFAVDFDRLRQVSAELVPDETHKYDDDDKNKKAERIENYFNVFADIYDPLLDRLLELDDQPEADQFGVTFKVYCCGYDWRQDTARTALRLAAVVEEALQDTGAKGVILIGHSMGCNLCRYYCRVLAGEKRVHRLILLGSPSLGSPAAYNYLKGGPPGIYGKDIKTAFQTADTRAATFELTSATGKIMQSLGTASTAGAVSTILGSLGDIYLSLCLGAGRWLSRHEAIFFARRIPALYQLIPGTVFCREKPNWVIFDPLATGYPPTGYMVVFPTLFEGLLETTKDIVNLADSAAAKGDELEAAVESFLATDKSEHTSGRAKRNAITLAEFFELIADSGEQLGGALEQAFQADDWDQFTASFEDLALGDAVDGIKQFVARLKAMFMDCRNSERLYSDIYTGMLDYVDMRAVAAGNLALALRCDQALTVDHRYEAPLDAIAVAKQLIEPALERLKPASTVVAERVSSAVQSAEAVCTRPARAQPAVGVKPQDERSARAYMPPRTVNIYCDDLPVEGGGVLFPWTVISNDDSNVVDTGLLPNLPVTIAGYVGDGGGTDLAFGDATVPSISVNPPEHLLSHPFLSNVKISKVMHTNMCQDARVIDEVQKAILDSLSDYTHDRLQVEPVTGAS